MKVRIISGVIGAAFVALLLVFRNTVALNIILALALLIAVYEALFQTKCVKSMPLLSVCLLYSVFPPFFHLIGVFPHGLLITFLFMFALLCVSLWHHQSVSAKQTGYAFFATLLITLSLSALTYLNAIDSVYGLFYLILAFCGAWIGDTGAYFVGSRFGKHKLAPEISPKKTIEGAIGGILTTMLVFLLVGIVYNAAVVGEREHVRLGMTVLLGALCSVVGMIGDLSFAFIKRGFGIKDFGNLIPGHGGLLDRVDSLILVAPFVYIFYLYVPLIVIQ
mgnify:FL=1